MFANAVKAELRKFFTTRLWWGMGLGVLVAALAFTALSALFLTDPEFAKRSGIEQDAASLAQNVYSSGIQIAYVLTLAIGVMSIGSEYRHKTITGTFLANPRRPQVMLAKVVSLLGIGAFYGLVSLIGSVSVGATILAMRGYAAFPDASVFRTMGLMLLVLGLWALIGLGAGILIPNQVAALMIGVGSAFVVEPILQLILLNYEWGRSMLRFFPGVATSTVLSPSAPPGMSLLPWWGGALVLVGYAALMSGVGTLLTTRRDIS